MYEVKKKNIEQLDEQTSNRKDGVENALKL